MTKKVYVIGSSSTIAAALENLGGEYTFIFIGRSNPHGLARFIQSNGMTDEKSVDTLAGLIRTDIEATKGLLSTGLIILSGVSSNDWRESFLVNEYLPARLSQEFAQLVSGLGLENCSIALVSSSAAYQGAKLPYATTKASLTGIVHTIARDFREKVRINVILPSAFESDMIADWDEEKRAIVAAGNYIGRLGTADDMADALLFIINNRFITNSILNMTGGTIHI